MSDFWDWGSLIVFSAFAWSMRIIDIQSSIEMARWGIKEENWYAQGKGKVFSETKAWLIILVPFALVYVAFFAFDESEHWDRFYAGFFLIPSGLASLIAARHNRQKIANRKERMISPGGLKG